MSSIKAKPSEFIEPFAGGGIVSLTVAFEGYADHVTLIELDDQVAAVWKTILGRNGKWLANRISSFELTYESAREELSKRPKSISQKAFQTLLKNRIHHGGILANGSGMLKRGENGKGILSRWYPSTLKKRILAIVSIKDKLTFIEGDGIKTIRHNARRDDVVFFIDPPYTAGGKRAGKRLYKYSEIDHEDLFRIADSIKGDFLLTYDNAPEVHSLARKFGFDTRVISMKNTHHATMKELLIGRNLTWVD